MSGARPASTTREPQGVWQPDLFWEVPLGFLSFAFYRLNRAVISRLYRLYLGRSKARALSRQTAASSNSRAAAWAFISFRSR